MLDVYFHNENKIEIVNMKIEEMELISLRNNYFDDKYENIQDS